MLREMLSKIFIIKKKKKKSTKPQAHHGEQRDVCMSGQVCTGEAKSMCGKEGGRNREGSSLLLAEGLIPYF